jgi:hypothetical protein
VVYIRAVEIDDPYNRVKDISYSQQTVDGTTTLTEIKNYTRVWEVFWTIYGPNSFNNGRLVRTRLFDQDIHDLFANSQLYFVTDPSSPRRVPEEKDGQWWERVDFSARFNEFVTESREQNYVTSTEIVLYDSLGNLLSDKTTTQSGYGVSPYGDDYGV